jgi:hypothetical protein
MAMAVVRLRQRAERGIERRRQEVGEGIDELVIQMGKKVDGWCGEGEPFIP